MNRFEIIVPVYNAEEYIGKCLDSIEIQDYPFYDVLVIDDCSTDGTWDIIKSFNVNCIRNCERKGALHNLVSGIKIFGRDIIVTVDGDDFLSEDKVLTYLNDIYDEDVWMTYGSFLPLSGKYKDTCQPFDNIMVADMDGVLVSHSTTPEAYRKTSFWVTSHLRTFRKNLWDKIKDEDLRDTDGGYYQTAWDLAFMYPMIEMSGEHCRFIPEILYMYNDLNPICDGAIRAREQVTTAIRIKEKQEYERIDGDIL